MNIYYINYQGAIIIFFKSINVKKEVCKKIDIIFNGRNAGEILKNTVKYSHVTLVAAPNQNQDEFIIGFNRCKNQDNKITTTVNNLDFVSSNIDDYIFLHKDEYANYLKFKKKNERLVSISTQNKIKADYKNLSQRSLFKIYKISLATINKIVNDKY